jgi:hypothetical protein
MVNGEWWMVGVVVGAGLVAALAAAPKRRRMANREVVVGPGSKPALVVLWRRHLAGGPSPGAMGEATPAHRPAGTQRLGARRAVPLQSTDADQP